MKYRRYHKMIISNIWPRHFHTFFAPLNEWLDLLLERISENSFPKNLAKKNINPLISVNQHH